MACSLNGSEAALHASVWRFVGDPALDIVRAPLATFATGHGACKVSKPPFRLILYWLLEGLKETTAGLSGPLDLSLPRLEAIEAPTCDGLYVPKVT